MIPIIILASEETWNLVQNDFKADPHQPIRVKGIDRELNTFWLKR
jgi:class 3 adenylate cyclase